MFIISYYITYEELLRKDCKFYMTTTGVFTCSVFNFKTCFIGILCVTDSVGSVASSELLCSVVVARLSACFSRDSRRFIPVEIKDQFTVTTKSKY